MNSCPYLPKHLLYDLQSTDEGSSDESLGNSHSSLTASKISAAAIARKCEILERLIRTANPVLPNASIERVNLSNYKFI